MTRKEAINQLEELIGDRKSFISGDVDFNDIYKKDIEALEIVISALKKIEEAPIMKRL